MVGRLNFVSDCCNLIMPIRNIQANYIYIYIYITDYVYICERAIGCHDTYQCIFHVYWINVSQLRLRCIVHYIYIHT